ncbi:ATP-dependent Clp protease adaptor ClpS [Parapedobacter sp. DT-150]|uniref:ATP-dependent Clp protease adaptor ClpS n=1 Tax=Parapedobacter sp. DT-150 TaxID=3396162 RepID=UPI003F1DB63A
MTVETEEETYTLDEVLAAITAAHRLILWNDETNTFEHVINCLIKHLQYTAAQAEKIAWKVHTEGKCTVLEGTYSEVDVYRKILKSEGLTVSIE